MNPSIAATAVASSSDDSKSMLFELSDTRIEGDLDLTFRSGLPHLRFQNCVFEGSLLMSRVECRGLTLDSCSVSGALGLVAYESAFSGSLTLLNCHVTMLDLELGQVSGDVTIRGTTLRTGMDRHEEEPFSMFADKLSVGGDLTIAGKSRCENQVSVIGGSIGNQLILTAGQFSSGSGHKALYLDSLAVGQSAFFDSGFVADGEVTLIGATIGGDLTCTNARFLNRSGDAIDLSRSAIRGNVYLRSKLEPNVRRVGADDSFPGFVAEGCIRMKRAVVGGDVLLSDAQLRPCQNGVAAGIALWADRCDVGSLQIDADFEIKGELRALGAAVRGDLTLGGDPPASRATPQDSAAAQPLRRRGQLGGRDQSASLDLRGAQVGGRFVFALASCKGRVDLVGAQVSVLTDVIGSWPDEFDLAGLTYQRITSNHDDRLHAARVGWIGHQHPFDPQPYSMLASVLEASGDRRTARDVRIARERRSASTAPRATTRIGGWMLDKTIGFGYQPQKLLYFLVIVVFVVAVLLNGSRDHGGLVPNPARPSQSASAASEPDFDSVVLAAESLTPAFGSAAGSNWTTAPSSTVGTWTARLLFLLRLMGWVMVSLLAVGVARVVRTS